jgi:hypothetical protein
MMPWDVSTRWNLTFDMLEFATRYHATIDGMMVVLKFELRRYELVHAEWQIAMELQDILRVSNASHSCRFCLLTCFHLGFQRRNIVLLSWHPQPCHCHLSHGLDQQSPHCII